MMNFGYMNYGFGYNPFAMGNFCNPNYNFFSGGYLNSYSHYSISSFGSMPYNSVFGYQSFTPYTGYGNFYNQAPLYQPMPMYGMYPQLNSYSPYMLPRPNFSLNNFNTGFSTNPISQSLPTQQTDTQTHKPTAKERDLNKKGNDYGKEFLDKVKEIAKRLNCDYKDLLGVMNSESGINAAAQNKQGGASGLIQFMPKTAEMLGTTTDKLRQMSPIEQLDYEEECIKRCKKMAKIPDGQKLSGGQLYALIFLPARANREVLTTSNEAYYKANKGLDANKDGQITKKELDERVARFHVSDRSFLA